MYLWFLLEADIPDLFLFFVRYSFNSSLLLFFRENDTLLSRLSQSVLRSEEVPVALEAIQVQHFTSLHSTPSTEFIAQPLTFYHISPLQERGRLTSLSFGANPLLLSSQT